MNNIESERLIFDKFSDLSDEDKKVIGGSWANPFNARYNHMSAPYESVEELSNLNDPTFENLEDYYNSMFFRVVREKENGKIIGTCRFGKYHSADNNDVWDFGFNILLKYWGKGYGAEVLKKIVEIAREFGIKRIIGGADRENYASYKAMIKNGFKYDSVDNDGDYRYILDLESPVPSEGDCAMRWEEHLRRTKKDLGEDKFNRLEFINNRIKDLVIKLNSCNADEESLIKKYYEELNDIEEFKFN